MAASVQDIADEELLRRVMKYLGTCQQGRIPVPLWTVVCRHFALGSTYAQQLCRRFGLNPDKSVRP